MRAIFGIVYLFLFFASLFASFFVVFHLYRYSLNRRAALFMIFLFVVTVAVLLVADTTLFFLLPLDSLGISSSSSAPFPH